MQEKQIFITGLNINYKQIGDGNIPILLLHGWGLDSAKYIEMARYLSEFGNYKIYLLDLPGFGKSDNPKEVWSINEYTEFIKKFMNSFDYKSGVWIIIGHSFGGQLAIKLAIKYSEYLKVLILTGAAGIRHSLSFKQKIFYILAKTGKIIFSLPLVSRVEKKAQRLLYKVIRERDYSKTEGVMREIFKKVIREDLSFCLDKIKTPTLLVWGGADNSTPISDFRIMKSKIKNQKSIIIREANHSLPYQYPKKFANIVATFIKNID